jgi:peptidoglycan hydrolase-like protein with peptidoglycan-binding domain
VKKLIVLLSILPSLAFAQTFDRDLYFGIQNNPDVTKLQEFLTEQGVYSGPITGNFFSLTLSAVKQFQSAQGISPISGYFGPLSRGKANQILAAEGVSSTGVTNESGSTMPVTTTVPKTTNDVVSALMAQIQLLQQQLDALQAQQQTLQTIQQQQTTQTQQITQQTQTLQQIQQNTGSAPTPVPSAAPTPVPSLASHSPAAADISIQSSTCNLSQTNLKTEYILSELLQNGNTDGRIFMNAYILNQNGQNFYSSNPSAQMIITTSDHSNDKTLNGSGNASPCGFYYPYEFYATQAGTYTITYSVPTFNLLKTITINIKPPEKPIIATSGKVTFDSGSMAGITEYWFQASKPETNYSYMFAQCSDSDTAFIKVDTVSSLGADGLYYPRGRFVSGGEMSGVTTCKLINSGNSTMTIYSESDPVTFDVH